MDGYHYYRRELDTFANPEEAHKRRGAPFTFNATRLVDDLKAIAVSSPTADIYIPSFNHEDKDPVEDSIVVTASSKLIIVEGLYLLYEGSPWNQLIELFDASLYLSTPLDVSLQRCALRNSKALGISFEEALHRVRTNDEINGKVVEGTRGRATHIL
jgi:pantothenate kinase